MERTFEEWIEQVDNAVGVQSGLSVHDLPDMDYQAMYESDVKPATAARRAIRNAQEG